jgi:hypothetical protein
MSSDGFKTSGSSPTQSNVPDFVVENHGSVFLLRPVTPAANSWVDEHLPEDRMTFGGAIVVEHRYIWAIIEGIQSDRLTVVPR